MSTHCILCDMEIDGSDLLCLDCYGEGQAISGDSPHLIPSHGSES